jgi:trigger factor
MQIKQETLSPTSVKLTISASQEEIDKGKNIAVVNLGKNAKLPGFRAGKAPAAMLEKNLDQASLQNEFMNETINLIYPDVIAQTGLRVTTPPDVSVTKFVAYTELEFTATVEVVGDIKLADYKNVKVIPTKASVTAKDVDAVMKDLATRAAVLSEVKRAAKNGDEVEIDFSGVDTKIKQPITGASGNNYDLELGSKSFIPGFEEELVGLKAKESKTFDITFPKDYGVEDLKNRKVTFAVKVHKVRELQAPVIDDEFAETVGPFKTVAELKADIKTQLLKEKQNEADQKTDNDLMQQLADKTEIAIPDSLIEQEIDRLEDEERRSLVYRGQTWQEHLDAEGIDDKAHREREKPIAEMRIKTGIILAEVADKEGIDISQDELDLRISLLKGQYTDTKMQEELDSSEGRRDIRSRMLVEKTLDFLRTLAIKK